MSSPVSTLCPLGHELSRSVWHETLAAQLQGSCSFYKCYRNLEACDEIDVRGSC